MTHAEWLLLLSPAGLLVSVVVHAMLARCSREGGLWRHLGISLSLGLGFMIAVLTFSAVTCGDVPTHLAVLGFDTISFLALGYVYAEWNNIPFTSTRLRVLRECRSAGGLDRRELVRIYDGPEVIRLRIDRYLAIGQLREREGRIFVRKGWVYWMVRFYAVARVVLFGKG